MGRGSWTYYMDNNILYLYKFQYLMVPISHIPSHFFSSKNLQKISGLRIEI